MDVVVEVKGISKSFGRKKAVSNIDFSINKGQIFGLLGPNGSGKTTTLSMILTLLKPDAGSIRIFDNADLESSLKKMGVLLESTSYYPELSAINNLKITCRIKNVNDNKIDEALRMTGLYNDRHFKVKSFSLGMKQRLSMASVILGEPELLIFDEPTNGLDPLGIAEMRQLILAFAAEGKTILIASHLLNEMEKICTHIAIMKNGTILQQGEMNALMQGHTSLEEYFLTAVK